MSMNLIVPLGKVRFVLFDDRNKSKTKGQFFEVTLSRENYKRLTVSRDIWIAFQGVGFEENMILNIGSVQHAPDEVIDQPVDFIPFDW